MILSESPASNPPPDSTPPQASSRPVIRFAPSPTGLLHLGHVRSALLGWHRARAAGGRFLLRLEDIDTQRCTASFAASILEDLTWIGLDWDGPVRVQSEHFAAYRAVLETLRGEGLLYPCFCSRAEILRELSSSSSAPHRAPDGALLYPGTCRELGAARSAERIASGAPHALRLDMRAALSRIPGPISYEDADADAGATGDEAGGARLRRCHPEAFGDLVLARRDAPASYHLCVTHDDWIQGVSLVVRGEDLREATGVHRLLQTLLGWMPPAYSHHFLLADADGHRLSKRDHALTIRAMRESGMPASEIRAAAGFG